MMFRVGSWLKSHLAEPTSTAKECDNATSGTTVDIVNLGPRTILKAAGVTYIVSTVILLIVLGYSGCYEVDGLCKNEYVRNRTLDYLPLYIFVGVYFLLIPCFLYLIKNVQDSYFIKLEFQLTLSTFFTLFCIYLFDRFVFKSKLTPVGDQMWLFSVVVLCHTISVTAPAVGVILLKLRPAKDSIILMDRRLFEQFKKSLAEDFCIENGLFFENLQALENDENKRKNSPKQYESSIIALYQEYIRPGANYELNIPASTRKRITQEIQSKN